MRPLAAGTSRISPSSKIIAGSVNSSMIVAAEYGTPKPPARSIAPFKQSIVCGPRIEPVRTCAREDVGDAGRAADPQYRGDARRGEPLVQAPLLERRVEQPAEVGIVDAGRETRFHDRDVEPVRDAGGDGVDAGERTCQ